MPRSPTVPATRLKICRHLMPFTNILCLKTYKTSQTRHAGRFQFKKLNHFACFFGFTSRLLKPTCTCTCLHVHLHRRIVASSYRRIVANKQTNSQTTKVHSSLDYNVFLSSAYHLLSNYSSSQVKSPVTS
jgi:hypothetical protein